MVQFLVFAVGTGAKASWTAGDTQRSKTRWDITELHATDLGKIRYLADGGTGKVCRVLVNIPEKVDLMLVERKVEPRVVTRWNPQTAGVPRHQPLVESTAID